MKRSFREPIPEILDAARYLDAAVSAHINGHKKIAEELFVIANNPIVWAWTDSIWGKKSQYVKINKNPNLHKSIKSKARMPTAAQKAMLHERDGFHCRFCGIPVIRSEIRTALNKHYPNAIPWGRTNDTQHAAFQCMWVQYDHVTPHSSGGENTLENLIVTCAACNYGKNNFTLEELGLIDPREFPPIQSQWDGLERLLNGT
jgi:hypothetical protein